MSNLSQMPDGFGYHYGFRGTDPRQVNVRREADGWKAYVAGEPLDGFHPALVAAEAAAYEWMDANPITPQPSGSRLNIQGAVDALNTFVSTFTNKAPDPTDRSGPTR